MKGLLLSAAAAAAVARADIYRVGSEFESLSPQTLHFNEPDHPPRPSSTPEVSSWRAKLFGKSPASPPRAAVPVTGTVFDSLHGPKVAQQQSDTDLEGAKCEFFPEILLVQDVSSSYEDDIANIERFVPDLFELFQDRYQGKARFGVVSFVDKSTKKAGWSSSSADYCAHIELPLAEVNTPEAVSKAQATIAKLVTGGGGDYLDGSNEALLRAALSSGVGWSEGTHDPETGRPIVRILILATDAGFHEAVYADQLAVDAGKISSALPPLNIASMAEQLDSDINHGCGDYDFPTADDLRNALRQRNVIPIVFAGAPSFESNGKKHLWSQYKNEVIERYNLKGTLAEDVEQGLAYFYGKYFSDQLRLDAVVEHIDESSSNFIDIFDSALTQIHDLTCLSPSTSPAPTGAPTTLAPAETPAPPRTDSPSVPPATDAPPATLAPPATNAPPATLAPPATNAPPATIAPPATNAPPATDAPPATIAPPATDAPPATNAPPATDAPPATVAPTAPGDDSVPPTAPSPTHAPSDDGAATQVPDGATDTTATDPIIPPPAAAGAGSKGVVIGAASGGATAAVAGGILAARKMGLLFNRTPEVDVDISQDVDNIEAAQDREQFEAVTGDLFA